MGQEKDLLERTFEFSVTVLKFIEQLSFHRSTKVVAYQLSKSATSIGANYEESQASQSKDDFYYKIGICLREARESNYWLRIIQRMKWVSQSSDLDNIILESSELVQIFGKIFAGRK